ncbi:MAG TPA: GGDEF domain-containing protein [Clostridia bacterium]|nr:GGDEF domain-containing protein [Clostridia bacterium]
MYKDHKIIALCITQLHDERNFDFVSALNKKINDFGYKLFIYHSHLDFYDERQNEKGDEAVFDLIDFDIVDAVIIYEESIRNQRISDGIVKKAKSKSVPVITIGVTKQSTANFILNLEIGFEKVVRHVIEFHKIKDTIMIAGRRDSYYSNKRIEVYKKVLSENNIRFDDSMLYYGDFWSEPTCAVMQELIDNNRLPKAIICANDGMAIAAIDTLHENDIFVPDDIVVTGFDGIRDARYNIPPVTTCSMNYEKLAYDIVLCIERLLSGKKINKENYTDQTIEVYSSCGCNKVPDMEHGGLLRIVRDRYKRFLHYNDELHEMTERVFDSKTPEEIPRILEQYELYDCYVFVNDFFFDKSIRLTEDIKGKAFSDKLYLLYKTGLDADNYPMEFQRKDILPDIDSLIQENDPIIFTSLSSRGLPFGFLCTAFKIDIENYSFLPQFTVFLSNALSGYRNIRYLEDLSKRYEKLAEEDFLTGLLNRTGFYNEISRLKETIDTTVTENFIVTLVDLDGLKQINDNHGHHAGDQAIITIANIIKTIPIENKICVRLGGDEFLICSLCTDKESTKKIIRNHLFDNLKAINKYSANPFKISISIGFSSSGSGKIDIDNLLKQSDELMYNHKFEKRQGRNTRYH